MGNRRMKRRPEHFLRQLDFFSPDRYSPRVTVVGAGGIGSWLVLALSKLGLRKITVYDADRVERHNLPTTPYLPRSLGALKVHALKALVAPFGTAVQAKPTRYRRQKLRCEVLISAVDSMDTRRVLFREAGRQKIPFFIDGRIGGENLRVYAIQPRRRKDRATYQATLVPNYMIDPLPCTAQQVVDVGFVTAGLMVRAFRQWVAQGIYNPEVVVKQDLLSVFVAPGIKEKRRKK